MFYKVLGAGGLAGVAHVLGVLEALVSSPAPPVSQPASQPVLSALIQWTYLRLPTSFVTVVAGTFLGPGPFFWLASVTAQ